MALDNPEFDRAPLNPSNSDKSYNQLASQLEFITGYLGLSSGASKRPLAGIRDSFFAMVASAPPSGEDDYTDARYWLRRATPDPAIDSDDNAQFQKDVTRNTGLISDYITATNLSELPPQKNDHTANDGLGSHSLPPFTIVQVFAFQDGKNPLKNNYYFAVGGTSLVIKISSTAPGAGWYIANIWTPPTAASDPTANLIESATGIIGAVCFVANTWEVGLSGHMLAAAGVLPLVTNVIGVLPATSDGTPCYLIATDQYEDCSV